MSAPISKEFSAAITQLDSLERISVKFNAEPETMAAQKTTFDEHLKVAKAVKESLSQTEGARKQLYELKRRVTGLKYRIEEANGGLGASTEVKSEDVESLETLARQWKEGYDLYQTKELGEKEKEKLKQACCYPKFVKLLQVDKSLRNCFFKWVLRDNCGVDEFIQFPATCTRMKKAFLAGRVGLFAKKFQWIEKRRVQEGSAEEKVMTLPFVIQDGTELKQKSISILDENLEVNLRGNFKLTIKKVFEVFSQKKEDLGYLEFFGENGIDNWSVDELGWWDNDRKKMVRVDLSQENSEWWKELPIFMKLTKADLKERYGIVDVPEGKWIVVTKATRESVTLDVDKSHGYTEILIPNEDGTYTYYSFGKYAAKFPTTLWQQCLFIANTVEARVQYPDENPFFSHRQQGGAPYYIEPNKGRMLLDEVRKEFIKAREGNVVFQFTWENCAWWSQNLLERLFGPKDQGGPVPNYFQAPVFDAEPKIEPLKSVFNFARKLGKKLQALILRIVEFCFMSWRGITITENGRKVFKSTATSLFRKYQASCLPGNLHKKIQNGEIDGIVTFGHLFQRQGL